MLKRVLSDLSESMDWGIWLKNLFIDSCPSCGFRNTRDFPVCLICEKKLFFFCKPRQVELISCNRWLVHHYCFEFHKNGIFQKLLFHLKYKGRKKLAQLLAQIISDRISHEKSGRYKDVLWVPVPLHPKKLKLRGFNQATLLAMGLAEFLGGKVVLRNLVRTKFTQTQARMSLAERQWNVHRAFDVRKPEEFQGKKIILVDDVFTTGATLFSCFESLVQHQLLDVELFTLARRS